MASAALIASRAAVFETLVVEDLPTMIRSITAQCLSNKVGVNQAMKSQTEKHMPAVQRRTVIRVVNPEWQAAAMERCKAQAECANIYGVTWRFRLSQAERITKCRGRCLCEEHGNREVTAECDLVLGE